MLVETQLPLNPRVHVTFAFRYAVGIYPELQKKAAAKAILTAAFKEHLDAFLDEVYAAHPFDRREMSREERVYRDYQWAVRFQFRPESAEAIAKSDGVRRQRVDKVVQKKILPAVGLSPRTEEEKTRLPPGRKPEEA